MKSWERDASKEELDRAIDTIAALLRAYGAHAFDLGDAAAGSIREACESWAQRVLVGPSDKGGDKGKGAAARRDFPGARSFLAEQRRRESEYVQRSLRDLRQAIWFFVRGLSRAVSDDRVSDVEAHKQIGRLVSAVDSASAEELKREAEAAVSLWGRHLSERQGRQRQHLKELSSRLSSLQTDLGEPEGGGKGALDPLTRLPTEGAFLERLSRQADLALVLGRPLAVLVIDVDRLRAVNDARGTAAGDALLRELGRALLRQFFRRDDFVARLDGGTFGVILPETLLPGALGAAQRARPVLCEGTGAALSIGVSQHRPGEPPEALLLRARAALQRAKGGNGVAAED